MKIADKFIHSYPEFAELDVTAFDKKEDKLDDGSFLKNEPSAREALLDSIYALNPETGFPQGDISVYLSDDCNPQIREFIRSTLMVANNPIGSVPEGQEVLLHEMRMFDDETLAEYGARIGANAQKWYEASLELSKD